MKHQLPELARQYSILRQSIVALIFLLAFTQLMVYGQCPTTITPQPATGVLISGNTVKFCAGDSAILAAVPTGNTGFQWYKNNVLITDSVRNLFIAKEAGSYKVKSPGCDTYSNDVTIIVNPLPTASISSVPLPPICSGTEITLILNTNASEFYWLPPVPPAAVYGNPVTLTLYGSTLIKAIAISNSIPQCSKVATYWVQVDFPINGGLIADNQTICSGEVPAPLTHVADPSGGNGTYSYTWMKSTVSENGPWSVIGGATGTSYTPTQPLTQTTWYARAAQSPPCSEGLTNIVMVQVNAIPTVNSASSSTICSGHQLNHTPTSATEGTTFSWTAALTSGTVTGFTPSGTGAITDILTLPAGSSTSGVVTYTITPVGPAPTHCIGTPFNYVVTVVPLGDVTNSTLTQTICAGGTTTQVTLTSSLPGTTFSWTAAVPAGISMNPSNGTGNIPAMTINSTNTDPVNINITITPTGPEPWNCTGSPVVYTIAVNPLPVIYNVTGGGEYCAGGPGLEIGLDGSQMGVSYQLQLNGINMGSPLVGTANYVDFGSQTQAGTYTVLANNLSTGCNIAMAGSPTIAINPKPVAVASPSPTIPIPFGTSTTFSASSVSGGTAPFQYLWAPATSLFGPLNILHPATINLYATTPFTFYLTDSKDCKDTATVTVVMNGSPLEVIVAATPDNICNGETAQLTGNGTGGSGNYTYSWVSNPAGFTSTQQNPVVSPTATTTFTLSVNDGFNTQFASVTVAVNPLPVQYTITGGGSTCAGSSNTEIGLSGSSTGTSYHLRLNGAVLISSAVGTGSPISFGGQSVSGTYSASALDLNTGCSQNMAGEAIVVVFQPSVGGSVAGGTTIVTGAGSGLLSLTGQTGTVIKWQSSTDNGINWIDIANTADTYTSGPLTVTTWFRAEVQNGDCPAVFSDHAVVSVSNLYSLSGNVVYANTTSTPLDNIRVIVKQNLVPVDTTLTDGAGVFQINNLSDGTYTLSFSTLKPWGGVDSTDATCLLQHVAAVAPITEPSRLLAGDVNNSGNPNALDVAKIYRRLAGEEANFARADWLFQAINGTDTVVISGADATRDFEGICAGDVNGSFAPPPGPFTPTTTTDSVNAVTTTGATVYGSVMSDGGLPVTERGFCYGTSQNPTILDSVVLSGTGIGPFTANLTNLTAATPCFVRAFATNGMGTAYGDQLTFTPQWTCGVAITINHVAGAVAPVNKTVSYGTVTNIPGEPAKCWITSNLGADHQATAVNDATEASAGWYWQFNRKQGFKHDGTGYIPAITWVNPINENSNWTTSNDPCNIELGEDWRLPTSTEWNNVDAIGGWSNWNGPWGSLLKLNAGGALGNGVGTLSGRGIVGWYWSATQINNLEGYHLRLDSGTSYLNTMAGKSAGFTLRCLKD